MGKQNRIFLLCKSCRRRKLSKIDSQIPIDEVVAFNSGNYHKKCQPLDRRAPRIESMTIHELKKGPLPL
jgi:hypothetical protein